MHRAIWLFVPSLVCSAALLACETDVARGPGGSETAVVATATGSAGGAKVGPFVQPPALPFDPNPLRLSGGAPSVASGTLVYAPSQAALDGAKEGSSLVLHAAEVVSLEGSNIVVRSGRDPSYPVHPAYVLVPPSGTVRRGSPVLAPHRGFLAHGLVTSFKRTMVAVRYTDAGLGYGEQPLQLKDVAPQSGGLAPGNYAVYPEGESLRQALLLSSSVQSDGKKRWLVLGYGSACALVDEDKLQPIPLQYAAKVGAVVSVAWLGTMVPAHVTSVDPSGVFTVRRARVGPAIWTGPGLVTPPPT